jgi:hypothetical protein
VSSVAVPLRERRPGVGSYTAGSCESCWPRSGPTSGSDRRSPLPLIFVIALAADSSGDGPDGPPFASYVRDT